MEKALSFLLVLIMIFLMSACADTFSASDANSKTSATQNEVVASQTVTPKDETVSSVSETTTTVSQIVYITETGSKYHSYENCPGLSRAKAIYESTLAKAENLYLGPCSKCH